MYKIAFVDYKDRTPSIPIAAACGVGDFERSDFIDIRRYENLKLAAKSNFKVVPRDEANILIYPHKLKRNDIFPELQKYVEEKEKVCLFFRDDDDYLPTKVTFGRVYRNSIFSTMRKVNEYAMPALVYDLLQEQSNSEILLKKKETIPSIGFCGYSGNGLYEHFYLLQLRIQKFIGLHIRHKVLSKLESSNGIKALLVKRNKFRAGAPKNNNNFVATIKKEFVANIIESGYSLALRGMGNFSHRFYEILCCGKIPVFINTRCVLPFENEINWKKYCIWVEENDIPRIGEIILDFHKSISPMEYLEMQHKNRVLWQEWLSPEGFYDKLFKSILREKT